MTWLARVASVASLSAGFAQALTYFWPAAGAGWGRGIAIVLPVAVLTWINVVGVKAGVRTAMLLVTAKLLPLLLLVGAGVWRVSWSGIREIQPPGEGSLGAAA